MCLKRYADVSCEPVYVIESVSFDTTEDLVVSTWPGTP